MDIAQSIANALSASLAPIVSNAEVRIPKEVGKTLRSVLDGAQITVTIKLSPEKPDA